VKKAKAAAGKPARPAKPAPLKAQKAPQHVTARKTSSKHAQTAKHKSQKHAAKRGWSPDEAFPWCSARAVCEALGLSDPWAIHTLAGGSETQPVSILAALDALSALASEDERPQHYADEISGAADYERGSYRVLPQPGHALILGVDEPEPHAVAVAPDGRWWSWGELYEPWTDQISEAWVIT